MITLSRRRALGDVVLLGAVTGPLGPCAVATDPRYAGVAARLVGVAAVLPWGSPTPGPVVDLDGRAWWGPRLRKRSLRRRLGFGRPSVPSLYGEACGVTPAPPPWIRGGGGPRESLALIPGASTALKRWAPRSYAAVGRAWGGPVVVVGGPGDRGLVEEVQRGVPGALAVVEDGFDRTIDALLGAEVAVGSDSGLLHLAAACGAAPVALFGPTHPRDGFFPYERGRVVSLALPCRPCTLHRREVCPVEHHGCMGQPVDAVIAAVTSCASR